jgi:hypothetical protein
MPKSRLEAFSDCIIAFAITLLILDIHLSIHISLRIATRSLGLVEERAEQRGPPILAVAVPLESAL